MTPQQARRIIALLDLTSLGDADTPAMIDDLCRHALTPAGPVAAVCLWPQFVPQARRLLAHTPLRIATVINFPAGEDDPAAVAAATLAAVADGADEIDVVLPWRQFIAGDAAAARAVLTACRDACGAGVTLKVIHESGAFDDLRQLRAAADLALECGADFLKTSTGKREPGASLAAVGVFFDAILAAGDDCRAGVKPSGGVRTPEQAAAYLELADRRMGAGWAGPATFRFGASALLNSLLPLAGESGEG